MCKLIKSWVPGRYWRPWYHSIIFVFIPICFSSHFSIVHSCWWSNTLPDLEGNPPCRGNKREAFVFTYNKECDSTPWMKQPGLLFSLICRLQPVGYLPGVPHLSRALASLCSSAAWSSALYTSSSALRSDICMTRSSTWRLIWAVHSSSSSRCCCSCYTEINTVTTCASV